LGYTLSDLSLNPGGRMAQTIKSADRQGSGDPSLPDPVLSGTSIALAPSEDGTKNFLTGFGLMHETPARMLGQAAAGDVPGLGYSVLGMLNPAAKGPLEAVTGHSFFREGEPLSDLDPLLGRIASNALETAGLRSPEAGPVPLPPGLDQLVSNSPLSRYATTIRTALDPRKSLGTKAAILGSGLRVTQQSPEAQRKILRRRVDKLAAQEGARVGQHGPYASDAQLARSPRLKQIIALRRQLDRESQRARRKKQRA
jgi:hypothetical protein